MPVEQQLQSASANGPSNLVDVLEKVLDKGVVIAGDITVGIADVELLTIKIRLIVASVDKAKEIGMDWWETDPFLSSKATENATTLEEENKQLRKRLEALENKMDTNRLDSVESGTENNQ
ncbi:gas vesicle protein [Virgibacillus phasianinus]|uniref:Gas vesicle protein n=1 Tax=Virgibacillus phasianinus TaxID=2017483 RepID=A0A220U214_9BACI|nr:gas vesicle protein [Virgibacillus phasianinus]ASK62117.1 gas vesicle protein [Virgibacillus phasianinus]